MASLERILARNLPRIIVFVLGLLGLTLTSRYSYLLFHTLAELFSIVIAGAIFILTWNFRRFYTDSFLLFIGTASLFIAGIDVLHALTYPGMHIFTGYGANLPTQLWIASRFLQSGSMLLATFFLGRWVKVGLLHGGFALLSGLMLLAIATGVFPACYVEGAGLTRFKIISELVIILFLAGAIGLLLRKRQALEPRLLWLLVPALVCTILAELAFAFHIDVEGSIDLAGHVLKIIASYLVYKAIVETEAKRIFSNMTRLRQAREALRESEATYRAIAQSIPNGGVYVFDRELRYRVVEGHALDRIGLTKEFMEGRTVAEVIPEERRTMLPIVEERCRLALAGETHSYETLHRGRVIWSQYAPLRDASGSVTSGMVLALDMTEQRKLEEEAHQNAARIEVQHELIEQRERDRLRIARDLHDGPVQTLTGAIFSLQSLSMECTDPQAARALETTRELMKEAMSELRGYAQELRPPILFNFGLERAFETHLQNLCQKYPTLQTHLVVRGDPGPLSEAVRVTIFRIFQESLNNTLKHAQATNLWVRLDHADGRVSLEIEDNGCGFDLPADELLLVRQGHLGLVGMRERAEAIGGDMEVVSHPGQGTRVRVHVPSEGVA